MFSISYEGNGRSSWDLIGIKGAVFEVSQPPLFLSLRNCSAEYIAFRRRLVTSHQSEGTVERGSQKPLSKMLGRRCSAFSAARAPGLVYDGDQQRAVPLPGLQAPFLPVCWQTVPVHIQSAHGDGTGGSEIV